MSSIEAPDALGVAHPIGSFTELRRTGRLLGKAGNLPVLVVWHEDAAFAIEDRCPHLGFPLHEGTIEAGLVTCHWHHARFDLASGCTLDPWADDATGFEVLIDADHDAVAVRPRPSAAPAERWGRRLQDGLEHGFALVIAKAVPALLELPGGERTILEIAYRFGERNGGDGWGSGMTVLTCMANLLPRLAPGDRPLALVHALTFLARDVRGQAPRFAYGALGAADQPVERVLGWYRRFVDTRNADGAERSLATAIASGASNEVEAAMFAAVTDHVYVDGGHTLDFTNKAFEALGHLGPLDAHLLTSLVAQTAAASRAEETSEWNHPVDLAGLAQRTSSTLVSWYDGVGRSRPGSTVDQAEPAVSDESGESEARTSGAALGWALLDDAPEAVAGALVDAARDGASLELLARSVAFAAGLRLARFHTNNDPGDWDTVHHTFTFANAVHQAIVRRPTADLARGVVHGALRVYLDRFLNVPAARLPRSTDGDLAELTRAWDVQGSLDLAATTIWGFLEAGGNRDEVIAALGHALLQEDAGFHWYQNVEAATRQALAWPEGSAESALLLVGCARFLAAHTPTRRELATVARTAVRLRRGEELFTDS